MRYARPQQSDYVRPFSEALDRLGQTRRPLLAISGGGDSLALLLLMQATRPGRFAAATFDHGLRREAAAEAAMVGGLCEARGVPHVVLHPGDPIGEETSENVAGVQAVQEAVDRHDPREEPLSIVLPQRGSLQARARVARYDALAAHAVEIGCDTIMTAHHRDDQAETFLMRANRGSGVDGLAGVRAIMRWDGIVVWRPLLDWRRVQLADLVRRAGITPVDDPSNADPAYDRARVRQLLAGTPELDASGLVRSAAAMADASEALQWTVDELARDRIANTPPSMLVDPRNLPREYRRRLLIAALAQMDGRTARGAAIDGVIKNLDEGTKVSLGSLLLMVLDDGRWKLWPAPPRRLH